MRRLMFLGLALTVFIAGAAHADASAARGEQKYQLCVACHGAVSGSLGPTLNGVIGRPAAAVEDFRYSNAMKRSGIVWSAESLKAFIESPQSIVKGNRMPFAGMTAEDAADLVAYLATLK